MNTCKKYQHLIYTVSFLQATAHCPKFFLRIKKKYISKDSFLRPCNFTGKRFWWAALL